MIRFRSRPAEIPLYKSVGLGGVSHPKRGQYGMRERKDSFLLLLLLLLLLHAAF